MIIIDCDKQYKSNKQENIIKMMKGGYFRFSVQRNISWEIDMKEEKVTSMMVIGFSRSACVVWVELRMD